VGGQQKKCTNPRKRENTYINRKHHTVWRKNYVVGREGGPGECGNKVGPLQLMKKQSEEDQLPGVRGMIGFNWDRRKSVWKKKEIR